MWTTLAPISHTLPEAEHHGESERIRKRTERETGWPDSAAGAAENPVIDAFRRWGYLEASLDPLGLALPRPHPELQTEGEAAARARGWYCGPIGVEFMHIPDPARRRWVQERMERPIPPIDAPAVLERLVRADLFEEVLHGRYPGSKRFSLEGVTGLIPLLDEVLETAAAHGLEETLIGMSHRGRLNVMVQIVGRSALDVYAGFEDADPKSVLGSGDVKYHMGATGTCRTKDGRSLRVKLVSNPSHLEAVYPVALGRTRARQVREGEGARGGSCRSSCTATPRSPARGSRPKRSTSPSFPATRSAARSTSW